MMPAGDLGVPKPMRDGREGQRGLIAAATDEILGFTVFGVEASELLAPVQTAMVGRLPFTELRRAIYVHPTIAEGLTFLLRNTPTAPGH